MHDVAKGIFTAKRDTSIYIGKSIVNVKLISHTHFDVLCMTEFILQVFVTFSGEVSLKIYPSIFGKHSE